MIKELKEVLKKEAEQNGDIEEVNSIENATTLFHLGYTFTQAIKKLKEAGVTIVLTEEEKEKRFEEIRNAHKTIEDGFDDSWSFENGLTNGRVNMRGFESTSDIVMVHKTNYAPKSERIESRHSGGVLHDCSITLDGEEYSFTCKSGRDTVHLSANHEVGANDGGSWSKMKYAVVIPFEDLKEHSTIKSAKSVDTYTKGAVKLTENSFILCPKGESVAIQRENPNVTIVEYEGEFVQDYANMLISELGYKLELGNDHGFEDTKQASKYFDIMTQEGLSVQSHFHSEDKENEKELGKVYQVVGLMKLISDKQLIEKIDREQLIEELNSQHFFELVEGILGEEAPYNNEFIEELKSIGINVSIDGLRNVFESHKGEDDQLDMPYESILTGYMLDAIAERSKGVITAKDIAEADREAKIASSEIYVADKHLHTHREYENLKSEVE